MIGISVFLLVTLSGCAAQAAYWSPYGRLLPPVTTGVYKNIPPLDYHAMSQGNTPWNYSPNYYDYHQNMNHMGSGFTLHGDADLQHSFIKEKSLQPVKVININQPSKVSPQVAASTPEMDVPRNLSGADTMNNFLDFLEKSINPHHPQGRANEYYPDYTRGFVINGNTYYDHPYAAPQMPAVAVAPQLPPSLPAVVTPSPVQAGSPANALSLIFSAAKGLLEGGTGTALASTALSRLPTVLIQGLLIKISSTIAKDGLKGLIAKILVPLLVLVGVDVLIIILSWWLWDDSCALAAITASPTPAPLTTPSPAKFNY